MYSVHDKHEVVVYHKWRLDLDTLFTVSKNLVTTHPFIQTPATHARNNF